VAADSLHRCAALLAMAACASGVAIAQSAPAAARSVRDGVYTAAQAARGQALYDRRCAECHMPDLSGHEYAGPLAGFGFQLKWQDATLAELLGRMRGMPLGRPGSLTGEEYVDVLAYVLQKNDYPAGDTPLTASAIGKWPRIRIERNQQP
jgi:S-disulfanyl-L-cysteine oxidoreductase SoxD